MMKDEKMEDMKKQELTQCDECCSKDLKYVPEKGETWCNACGLVHKDQEIEANDNGAALFGEGAHYHAVRNDKDVNRRLGGTGPKMKFDSRSVKNKKKVLSPRKNRPQFRVQPTPLCSTREKQH